MAYSIASDVMLPPDNGSSAPAPGQWQSSPAQGAVDYVGPAIGESAPTDLNKFADVVGTSFRAAQYDSNGNAWLSALRDAAEARNKSVLATTGVQLENPLQGGYEDPAQAAYLNTYGSGARPARSACAEHSRRAGAH